MKAAIFNEFGSADVLRIVDLAPPTPKENEVLVRIRAAAVNPKDTFIRKGRFAALTGSHFPMTCGFDFSGEVAETNEAAGFEKGAPVFGMLDGWYGATCAQYISVKPHQLRRKPANLSFEEAAALPLVSLTALQALRDEARIESGFHVCINGAAGGVGSMAVQIARRYDAAVTAVSSEANHAMLNELGADRCIDYHHEDVGQSGRRFDIFFDVFGNRLFDEIAPILSPQGTWVSTVLRPEVGEAVERTKDSTGRQAKLVIVRSDSGDLDQVRRWVEAGLIRPVIHAIYPLSDIAVAQRQQESKHTRGKLVVSIP